MLPSTHMPLLLFLLVRQGEREDPSGQMRGAGWGWRGSVIDTVSSASSQATPPALEYYSSPLSAKPHSLQGMNI